MVGKVSGKWCEDKYREKLKAYMHSLTPVLDLLVVHMDGDVQRCEKEVHCVVKGHFVMRRKEHIRLPVKIIGDRNECPVALPCEHHGNTPDAEADFKNIHKDVVASGRWTGCELYDSV